MTGNCAWLDSIQVKNNRLRVIPEHRFLISTTEYLHLQQLHPEEQKHSVVSPCFDEKTQQTYSVKFSFTTLATFLNEAFILKNFKHPHIVKLFTLVSIPTKQGSINGIVLESLLPLPTTISSQEVILVAKHIGSALDFLHASGYAHLDVKSSNIMLRVTNEKRQFVLIDFESTLNFKKKSTVWPEKMTKQFADFQGASLDQIWKLDQYSLALTILELLDPSFYCQEHERNFFADDHMNHVRISSKVPQKSIPVFKKALSKNRKDRYVSCTRFARSLEQAFFKS